MWKKEEDQAERPPREAVPPPERSTPATRPVEGAVIGPSISIHGEVTGDEDLLIQGRVDGSVSLKQHSVTVGPEGHVKADIVARVITVEGKVEGNLDGDEQVILRKSAVVDGDIKAPRVALEDGARFRGGVDMGERAGAGKGGRAAGGASRPAGEESRPTRALVGTGETSPEREESTTERATDPTQ